MSKSKFIFCIKVLILLSPLPFASVTRIWSPLFYLILLVVSGLAISGIQSPPEFLYHKKIKLMGGLFLLYTLFQLIPLPRFILNVLSPSSVELLDSLSVKAVQLHSISLVPADTLMFILRLFVMFLFFWVLVHLDLEKSDIYSLIRIMALSAFIQAGFGGIKWLFKSKHFFLFFYDTENPRRLMSGTFLHPDHLSSYLQMIIPLVIGLILIKLYIEKPWDAIGQDMWRVVINNRMLILYFLAIAAAAAGIILTKSMSGQAILFMSVCLMAIGFVNFKMKSGTIFLQSVRWTILIITLLVVVFTLQTGLSMIHRPDSNGNVRGAFWKDSWRVYSQFPLFGIGYGNFRHLSYQCQIQRDESKLSHPYNEFLEHLVEGGIPGFVLFFSVFALFLISLFRMWRTRRHPEVWVMGLAFLVSIITAGLHDFFDYALRIPANAFLFVLILALGLKMIMYKRKFSDEK